MAASLISPAHGARRRWRRPCLFPALAREALILKTDDSQIVALDTTGVSPRVIAATRPGDVVSVVGQITGGAFRAEIVQKE
jgi:hypothetical protein